MPDDCFSPRAPGWYEGHSVIRKAGIAFGPAFLDFNGTNRILDRTAIVTPPSLFPWETTDTQRQIAGLWARDLALSEGIEGFPSGVVRHGITVVMITFSGLVVIGLFHPFADGIAIVQYEW